MINNGMFIRLLDYIKDDYESFKTLVDTDNNLDLNVKIDNIINYLEFTNEEKLINEEILHNYIITEGDILSILKIIHDIVYYIGDYTLYINGDNIGTITYLVRRANQIYEEYEISVHIDIDYSNNYNKYLNKRVTVIGNNNFIKEISNDFTDSQNIEV